MKIALFRELPLTFIGGVTNVLRQILHHLTLNGHEAIIFAPDTKHSAGRFMGHRYIGVPFITWGYFKNKHFQFPYSSHKNIDHVFKRFKPDLIHLLHPVTLSWSAYTSAKRNNIPVLASYHTNYHIYTRYYHLKYLSQIVWSYTRWQFNKSKRVLSPSDTVKKMLVEGGIKRVQVWKRGVDSIHFSPDKKNLDLRKKLTNNQPEKTIFLFLSRLYKEKNIDFLAAHWLNLPDSVLVITGYGPERERLENKLKNKNVIFTGDKTGEELAQIYASADILLFPSATEGYPNVVMEAMASGLPVIGANSFGVSDIIQESQGGLLFEPFNGNEFQQKMKLLKEDFDLRKELGQKARAFGQSKSWELLMKELFQHYQDIIDGA